jgi:hypothetical protein
MSDPISAKKATLELVGRREDDITFEELSTSSTSSEKLSGGEATRRSDERFLTTKRKSGPTNG